MLQDNIVNKYNNVISQPWKIYKTRIVEIKI